MGIECNTVRSPTIGIVEVTDDEILKFLHSDLAVAVAVNHLHIGCNVGRSGLEAFVHGPVAVHQPLGHFYGLTDAVVVAVVGFNYFPILRPMYLAKFLHSSFENSPPFSTPV